MRTKRLTERMRTGWLQRFTIRTRLTVAFTALLSTAGAAIVLIVTVFMRTVPEYATIRAPIDSSVSPSELDAVPAPAKQLTLRSSTDILDTAFIVSLIVLVLLVAAGAVAAWLISGRLLRPLQAINNAAQLASTGSLAHRVALAGPKDELRDLSDTFDMMLSRLDSSFQAHQRFAANASHELRTPLATIQTMLEVALDDAEAPAHVLRDVAERVLETNQRNTETVEALLVLAEISGQPARSQIVNLTSLVRGCAAAAMPAATERDIAIEIATRPVTVRGDVALLRLALSNLITNAIRHNIAGGRVEIRVSETLTGAHVQIENTGPALTRERIDELTEPFVRGAGRASAPGEKRDGHGLGLAIVTNVVTAHEATLILSPRTGGGLNALIAFKSLSDVPPPG